MKINHKLINDFLNAVFPLPECFGPTYTDFDGDSLENFYTIKDNICKIDPAADVLYGASKLVIISPKLKDFVIKIPFNGYWSETFYEDGDNDELEWVDFYQAPTDDGYDYCYAEYEKYIDLKKAYLKDFVAATIFYKEKDGFRIFLQEKVFSSYVGSKTSLSRKSMDLALKWKKERKFDLYVNAQWVAACLDYYGVKKTKKFLNYCNEVDEDILSDCHEGNYGYRKDGSPVLLDFSGYSC